MSRTVKRLLAAGLVSACSYAATFYWYYSTRSEFQIQSNSGIQIAQIVSAHNDVNKRPLRRLVWKALGNGDVLYDGEAIKTSDGSEARIKFLDSNSFLDIEPNSLIVLEQKDNKISLDLLEGGLFVKSQKQGKNVPSITLKTKKGSVELSNTEASLSKGKDQDVNLQVLKGQAKVEVDGKKTTLEKGKSGNIGDELEVLNSSIEVLSPRPYETVYINPDNPTPLTFKFVPMQEPAKVYLELGAQRDKLERVSEVPARSGRIKHQLTVGRFFWRLAADDANGKTIATSPTYRMPVEAQMPPIPISPLANENIRPKTMPHEVTFQWSGHENYDSVLIQVAKDRGFKDKLLEKHVQSGLATRTFKGEGTFFWRLVGFKNKRPIVSQTFRFGLHMVSQLASPSPIAPAHMAKIAKPQSVSLSWSAVEGAVGYHIDLTLMKANGKIVEKNYKTRKTQLQIPKPPRGKYNWFVTAVGQKNLRSEASEQSSFEIEGYPNLAWLRKKPDILEYISERPKATLSWDKGPSQTLQYRIRVAPSKEELKGLAGVLVPENTVAQELPKPGFYFAIVEALDNAGSTVAKSKVRRFQVLQKALLPAPLVAENTEGDLKANRSGSYDLDWSPVSGAREYLVELKSEKSGKIKTLKYQDHKAQFKSLMPGQYKVWVHAVDEAGRRSPASQIRNLLVPKKSGLAAPTLKLIEVEDD